MTGLELAKRDVGTLVLTPGFGLPRTPEDPCNRVTRSYSNTGNYFALALCDWISLL